MTEAGIMVGKIIVPAAAVMESVTNFLLFIIHVICLISKS